jgi:bisphosphoglycerate-dependent phosphoglycerate mutase
MTELLLIRHGQAKAAATDEASYDRLSDLGRQQAVWLGEWLDSTGQSFDRIAHGSLSRQRDTARSPSDVRRRPMRAGTRFPISCSRRFTPNTTAIPRPRSQRTSPTTFRA